jgi:hypothetical protein
VPIKLKLIGESAFSHEGKIDFVDNAIDRSSGTIRARAVFANPGGRFTPGMFARVRTTAAPPKNELLVPDAAIGAEQVRKFVVVVDAVTTQLSQSIGRYWFLLGRAQIFKARGGLLQLGIEAADAEPAQRCFHSVDNPSLLSDETLALAVGPLGIFVLDCRDRDHLAVITLAAQPAEKDAFEQLGVETVGLGAPMLARYGYALMHG